MVYGNSSNLFVTKQQSSFGYNFPSVLLEYLDLFKPFVG